jgi:DNA-binding response OmpR family regulator
MVALVASVSIPFTGRSGESRSITSCRDAEMDRTLHVLAVVHGLDQDRHVQQLLRSIGAVYQVAHEIKADHIAFAHRLADVVIIAGGKDPLAQLAYLRLAGVDLPLVVFQDVGRHGWQTQLLKAGAAACTRVPRTDAELLSVLTLAVDQEPRFSEKLAWQGIALDPVGLTIRRRNRTSKLTRREYALLHCLVSRAGTPVSIARLQAYAWAGALPKRSAAQIVTVYIHQLRRKLRGLGLPGTIVTVRDYGYMFVTPAPPGGPGGEST